MLEGFAFSLHHMRVMGSLSACGVARSLFSGFTDEHIAQKRVYCPACQ